jgi:hypothetical protein
VRSHLLFEGEFVRASLYFGQLTAIAYSGRVDRFALPTLRSTSRLDAEAVMTFADRAGEPVPWTADSRDALSPPSNSEIVSLHSYDGVTYLGARDGLWAMAERTDARPGRTADYARLNDRPALDVDTTFGVAAIAHGDGVSVVPVGSRWLADQFFRPSSAESRAQIHTLAWAHHDIIGKSAPFEFEVIPGDFELRERDKVKHYVFKTLGQASSLDGHDTGVSLCAVASRSFAAWDNAQNRSTLFVKQRTGWSTYGGAGLDPEAEPEAHEIGSVRGRVISLCELGPYLVCELSDRISIVDPTGRESVLLDRAATDLRVYPRSQRYRGVVTAVSELGVHVLQPGATGS